MTAPRVVVVSACAICGESAQRGEPDVVTLGLLGNNGKSISFAAHLACVVGVLAPDNRDVARQLSEDRPAT